MYYNKQDTDISSEGSSSSYSDFNPLDFSLSSESQRQTKGPQYQKSIPHFSLDDTSSEEDEVSRWKKPTRKRQQQQRQQQQIKTSQEVNDPGSASSSGLDTDCQVERLRIGLLEQRRYIVDLRREMEKLSTTIRRTDDRIAELERAQRREFRRFRNEEDRVRFEYFMRLAYGDDERNVRKSVNELAVKIGELKEKVYAMFD